MRKLTQEEKDHLNIMPEKEYVEMELKFYREQVAFWEERLRECSD